jgi:hypothetical protein
MSTTALHIIQLVKSLPVEEQQAIGSALASLAPSPQQVLPSGQPPFQPEDYEGLPDDDPFFKVMEEIEQQRHAHVGRAAPELD